MDKKNDQLPDPSKRIISGSLISPPSYSAGSRLSLNRSGSSAMLPPFSDNPDQQTNKHRQSLNGSKKPLPPVPNILNSSSSADRLSKSGSQDNLLSHSAASDGYWPSGSSSHRDYSRSSSLELPQTTEAAHNEQRTSKRTRLAKTADSVDPDGKTPLIRFVLHKNAECVKILLNQEYLPNLNYADQQGSTALHYACNNGAEFKEITRLLIEKGADVDAQTKFGWTPLMIAVYHGDLAVARLLLQNGAKVHLKNYNDEDSLQLAFKYGNPEMLMLLKTAEKLPQNTTMLKQSQDELKKDAFRRLSNHELQQVGHHTVAIDLGSTKPEFHPIPQYGTLKRKTTASGSRQFESVNARSNLSRMKQEARIEAKEFMEPSFGKGPSDPPRSKFSLWRIFSAVLTCWAPSCILSLFGKKDKVAQRAWREKVALCFIILLVSLAMAFFTFVFGKLVCRPKNLVRFDSEEASNGINIHGTVYPESEILKVSSLKNEQIGALKGKNANSYYPLTERKCLLSPPSSAACPGDCQTMESLASAKALGSLVFKWENVISNQQLFIYNGRVYDASIYFTRDNGFLGKQVNEALQSILGLDGTKEIVRNPQLLNAMGCFDDLYLLGTVDVADIGCMVSRLVVVISLILLVGIILAKFFSAVFFNWFLSWKLGKLSKRSSPDSKVILLVTCYSEGEESIKRTLNSLAVTNYDDGKKLLFIVADGMVTGSGNARPTADIVVSMMRLCRTSKNVTAQPYISLGSKSTRRNMAKVYAGYYCYRGRYIPMVCVAKVGNESEVNKPGNRGKRDSQLILMSFLSKSLMNDRMTPLDYELFIKTKELMKFYPDEFDLLLMVDADTEVSEDSLARMVSCMERDSAVMGLCGETKIANKRESWVTRIQVFEYYISHHLGKAFESLFGGVTCLPGCFCMYRIKLRHSNGSIIPILANPDIVEEYSERSVNTLHKKNLLLLGEDRYLTTLMLKAFPKRKMMFVPEALCWTTVPNKLGILISQRRRWINSTIHNLLELLMVKELCGIFCCSMQFVICLELIGTVILPASVVFLAYLIFDISYFGPNSTNTISLAFMGAIIGLQAVLVLFTTRKLVYVAWMLYYILAIPIWNFILPVYAFWHFDDFTWGQTRKVVGKDIHEESSSSMQYEEDAVPLKMFHEYDVHRRASVVTAATDSTFDHIFVPYSEELQNIGSSDEFKGFENGRTTSRTELIPK